MKQELRNELIARHLQGKCSQSEQQEMDAWLDEDILHQEHYQDIHFIENQIKSIDFDFDPDTAIEWKKLQNSLDLGEGKIVSLNSTRRLLKVAAIFIGLLVSGFLIYQNLQDTDLPLAQEITAKIGETQKVNLPDGTVIHLNGGAKLTVQPKYNLANRDLGLEGEAYFEVAKNQSLPMVISTGAVQTKVVGTAFNLKTDEFAHHVEISVTEGMVEFSKDDEILQLTANKAAIFEEGKLLEVPYNANTVSWHSGELFFENVSLTDIFKALERKFGVSIIDQSSIGNTLMTDEVAPKEEIVDVLDRLKIVVSFNYKIEGNNILIVDKD